MFKVLITILLSVFLLGCAASGPKFVSLPINNRESIIVFYRDKQFVNGGAYPHIYIDGIKKGSIKNGGYIAIPVEVGAHMITLKNTWAWKGQQVWDIDVGYRKQYFYKISSELNSVIPIGAVVFVNKSVQIESVPASKALEEIKNCKLSK